MPVGKLSKELHLTPNPSPKERGNKHPLRGRGVVFRVENQRFETQKNGERVLNKNTAFTLAEVLITLVIIGVIAAITVPTLINKTNNQETVSRLKKAYSILSQATNLIIAEEGNPTGEGGWLSDAPVWYSFSDNGYNLYKKHLINAKECGRNSGCFNQMEQGHYKNVSGEPFNWSTDDSAYRKLILSDGVQVAFFNTNHIMVDLNGEKKPNQLGKDVFCFTIYNTGLKPNMSDDCKSGDVGWGCALKVLREGAINY